MNKLTPKTITLILYHVIVGSIIAANFRFDSWLMGWDGLYPELNIPLNLIRGLTAGWQEYYGAGLVGGHGFAATLPHTIIIGLLSTIIPQHMVREVFLFLCYYLGGLGMLFASHTILKTIFHEENWWACLAASLYYLLNLGSVQTFYLPLEAFTVHFAAFPWLSYGVLLLLEKVTKKRILWFTCILLLTSIQGFIPAIFVAYAVSLFFITGAYLLAHRSKQALRTILIIWACVIAANAYWLGPVGYFTFTGSKEYVNAYNNIISTPEFAALSIKYGTLPNVALLRGFPWQGVELGGPIMNLWIQHFAQPIIPIIGYLLFGISVFGLLHGIRTKHPIAIGFAVSCIYFFGSLAIATPPFSWLTQIMQTYSPSLTQAFRTTFTKFGVGMGFHYALFIAIGLHMVPKVMKRTAPLLISVLILIYAFPVWQSGLIYQKLFITLPNQYLQTIQFINTLPDGRIADFPQDCAEGWYNELWGYFGSGFLWYGINKPIMARAFDVWNHTNENYYWKLSTALRQHDYAAVEHVLTEYDIRYILYDQNMTNCRSIKGFESSLDFRNYLDTNPQYTALSRVSGQNVLPVSVYERKTKSSASYVSLTNHVDTTPSSTFSSHRGDAMPSTLLTHLSPIATVSAISLSPTPCGQELAYKEPNFAAQESPGDTVRMITTNTKICQTMTIQSINTSQSYVVGITSRHIAGEPLALSITNKNRPVGLDITIPKHGAMKEDYFLLPPSFPSEIEYTVSIQNTSYNQTTTINDIGAIHLYEYPTQKMEQSTLSVSDSDISVSHIMSWLYTIHIPRATQEPNQNEYIILHQSFDPGWIAYDRTNNKLLPNHTVANSWENSWTTEPNTNIVVALFLPQLLEFAGLAIIIIGLLALAIKY